LKHHVLELERRGDDMKRTTRRCSSGADRNSGKRGRADLAQRARLVAIFSEPAASAYPELAVELEATGASVPAIRAALQIEYARRRDSAASRSWDRALREFAPNAL